MLAFALAHPPVVPYQGDEPGLGELPSYLGEPEVLLDAYHALAQHDGGTATVRGVVRLEQHAGDPQSVAVETYLALHVSPFQQAAEELLPDLLSTPLPIKRGEGFYI